CELPRSASKPEPSFRDVPRRTSVGGGSIVSSDPSPANRMIALTQPATRWEDGLPTGNGQVGAMVYGAIAHDVVLLNHEALWLRRGRPNLPDVSHHLADL